MKTTSLYKTSAGEKAVMAWYDSILERWPVPHETLTLTTRYGNTFVIASGQSSSPPLLLLHGAGTNSAVWAREIVAYSRALRTYAVDLIGEAGRSASSRPEWRGPAYAEWLDDVLRALKVKSAVLVGMSQGAWVALKYTIEKPDRVEKLVLTCPGGVIPDRVSFVLRAVFYSLLGSWGVKRMVRMLYADQRVPEGVEERTAVLISNFRTRMGVLPIFSDEELHRLTMPTLLLGGTKDALRDIEKMRHGSTRSCHSLTSRSSQEQDMP